jgi:hypothetical protein
MNFKRMPGIRVLSVTAVLMIGSSANGATCPGYAPEAFYDCVLALGNSGELPGALHQIDIALAHCRTSERVKRCAGEELIGYFRGLNQQRPAPPRTTICLPLDSWGAFGCFSN